MATETQIETLGDIVPPDPNMIEVDVWRYILEDGVPTGRVKRVEYRLLRDIYRDIAAKLRDPAIEYDDDHRPDPEDRPDCYCFCDEYFSRGSWGRTAILKRWPGHVRHIACYAVTGGSEGHYVHIDAICEHGENTEAVHMFLGKTFRGMDHARRIATLIADWLGA